jgi:hypothetical protein
LTQALGADRMKGRSAKARSDDEADKGDVASIGFKQRRMSLAMLLAYRWKGVKGATCYIEQTLDAAFQGTIRLVARIEKRV